MKPPFPFAWPRRGSPARLPALLVPVLGALALVQLALPSGDEPVASPAVARLALPPMPEPPAQVTLPTVLAQRGLFATGSGPSGGPSAPVDPLGGIRIAGTVREGRALRAVIQWPGGRISYAGIGSRLGDWSIAALTPSAARLSGPAGSMTVAYGSQPSILPPASEEEQ